jgi:uncharacterized membrane protein (UPF0127 family)
LGLTVRIDNLTRATLVASHALVARTSQERRTGLLKRESLNQGEGLYIAPCEAVHTFFMKFAIDVLYLDRTRKVLKIRRALGPWRISACLRAYGVLELPAGTAASTGTRPGDQLAFEDSGPPALE